MEEFWVEYCEWVMDDKVIFLGRGWRKKFAVGNKGCKEGGQKWYGYGKITRMEAKITPLFLRSSLFSFSCVFVGYSSSLIIVFNEQCSIEFHDADDNARTVADC